MNKKYIYILFFLVLVNFNLFVQTEYDDLLNSLSDDVANSAKSSSKKVSDMDFKFSLLGDHVFDFHVPVIPDGMTFDGYLKSPKFKNDIGLEIKFKQLKLVSHWQIDLILNEWESVADFIEVAPLENYISWNPWKFTINVGLQEFNWGTADSINPTDNLNLRDYRDPIDPGKDSVFSMYTGFFPARFISIEAVYIPFYVTFNDAPTDIVEQVFTGSSSSIKDLRFKPELFGLGGKVNFFFRYADFSFSYLTVIDPYYSMDIDLTKVTLGPVSYYRVKDVFLYNGRLHHIGADLKVNAGIFGIWLEVCYTLTEDFFMNQYNVRNHQLSWTAGFDFNYGPNEDFYFNLQYFGRFTPLYYYNLYNDYENGEPALNKDEEYYEEYYYRTLTDQLADVDQGLLNGISLEMNWPLLQEKLTPAIKVMYSIPCFYDTNREIHYGNIYVNPEFKITPFETFDIAIGAEIFLSISKYGNVVQINEGNIFGTNYENSNVYLEVIYKWGLDIYR